MSWFPSTRRLCPSLLWLRLSGSGFEAQKPDGRRSRENAHAARPVTSGTAVLHLLRRLNSGLQCGPAATENDFRSPAATKRIGISRLHGLQRGWQEGRANSRFREPVIISHPQNSRSRSRAEENIQNDGQQSSG